MNLSPSTPRDRQLIEASRRVFRECDSIDATMRRFREGWIGRVRISMTLTSMIYKLPPILRQIRLDHPGIDLVITNTPTPTSVDNIIQLIKAGVMVTHGTSVELTNKGRAFTKRQMPY